MDSNSIQLEKHLRRTTIISNVVSVIVALATAIIVVNAFYYDTTQTLRQHTEQINEVKKDVGIIKENVKDAQIFQGITGAEITAMKDKVNSVEVKVDKMNDKLDLILMQTRK
jgi:hypothetical protein